MIDPYKYDIYLTFGSTNVQSLPKDIEALKISIVPYAPNQGGDWTLMIGTGSTFSFNTNFPPSKLPYRSSGWAEIHKWKEMGQSNPEYMLLTLTKVNLFDPCTDPSADPTSDPSLGTGTIAQTPNLYGMAFGQKEEYKLTFRPNLTLAKKLYMDSQNIPIKLIQIIYMFLRKDNSSIDLKDSESELMSPNPRAFKLQLYDYQAKTLTWMRQIESGDIKIKYYKDYYYGIPDPVTGEPFCYVSSKDVEETAKTLAHYHIYQDPPDFYKEFKINGGLLGDIMGNGKTVTGIAHVYSEHCRLGPSYPALDKGVEEDVYLPSRATLVLCPNNIIDQWYNEFVKCLGTMVIGNSKGARSANIHSVSNNGRNYRVIRIASMHDLNALRHADLINADAVIVTYTMMTNTNHIGKGFTKENGFSEQFIEQRIAKMSIPELQSDEPETWTDSIYNDLERVLPRKLLYLYKWNRVIHDEFHEVISTKTRTNSLLFIIKSLLKARYYWGFSGSSILENETILQNLPYLLHFEDDWSEVLPMTGINKTLFFDKCVIKNTKRILPPLKYVKIPVKPSEEEKMLYKAMSVYSNYEDQVRFACYHNLNATTATSGVGAPTTAAAGTAGTVVNRLLSADEIMAQQHNSRLSRITILTQNLQIMDSIVNDLIANLKNIKALADYPFTKSWLTVPDLYFLTDSGHKDHNVKVKAGLEVDPNLRRARDIVREYKKEIKTIESTKLEVKSLEEANRLYTNFLQNKTLTCSLCDFSSSECNKFMVLDCRDHFCLDCTELMVNSNQKMCPKCRVNPFDNTKLANLGSKDQIESEVRSASGLAKRLWGSKICDIVDKVKAVTTEDSTSKIIIFAQWEDLLEQFEIALAEVKIESCTVKGATTVRTKAIRTFQDRPSCKVILLSSVYGASGINLVEANYVFIVHPFLGDMSEQYEYQAICRAYRTGQKRTVTVMHFIREDTYEQVLYAKKEHKDEAGALQLLEGLNGSEGSGSSESSESSEVSTQPQITIRKRLTLTPLKPLPKKQGTTVPVPVQVPVQVPVAIPMSKAAPDIIMPVSTIKIPIKTLPRIILPGLVKPRSIVKTNV